MLGGITRALLLAAILLCLVPQRAAAINPETLLMPGKLTSAHQKYEEQCSQCHDRSNSARQTQLCLDCHKEVAADVAARNNYHGRLPGIGSTQCHACHTEHLGRNGDIVKLSREQFDHSLTEFPLTGAHVGIDCAGCHPAGKPFRKAPTNCVDCHHKEEPHAGRLGRDCKTCHDTTLWRDIHFDHNATSFPLHDRHIDVPCAGCHLAEHYKDTPTKCVSCHAPDDVHRNSRGTKCSDCHATTGWKTTKFDHAKETGFALLGAHSQIDCQDCHRSGNLQEQIPKDCFGCHQGQDAHATRFGQDCGQCHGNEDWKHTRFDHARDGHWELTGQHAKVACTSCHTDVVSKQKLSQQCASCHRVNDVHAGKLGSDCGQCHSTHGWRENVRFDHDLSHYPLLGQHVVAACDQCHATQAYGDTQHDCVSCHKNDDVHKGSLGTECARCHSPNGWRQWDFDHGKETTFALTGAHARLTCAGCHKQPADQVKLNPSCLSCHEQDDVHLGQYGRQCQRCHSTNSFKGARLR
ncbi:MAG: hypothetical protein JSR66_17520 [Proteobacteria bacterium]|nr:hypothetical protein [Pseudomonadota bacterium]